MKIHLTGAAGTGVTTLGKALAARIHLPYFDSDEYFWESSFPAFTQRRNPEKRNSMLLSDLNQQDSWVLGGSVIHWGDTFPLLFDLVVFLYVPAEIRLKRIKKREFERYGNEIYTNPLRHEQFIKFLQWTEDYDNNSGIANRTLQAHEQWLSTLPCAVLELRGDCSTEKLMTEVLVAIKTTGG